MASEGYCCAFGSDCKSGICIEKVCRDSLDPVMVKEEHSDKTAALVIALMFFVILAILISLCIMFHCNKSELDVEISSEPATTRRSLVEREDSGVKFHVKLNMSN